MSSKRYIDRTLENLKDQVNEENFEAIRSFINHQAAEGVGIQQQQRQIYALRRICQEFSQNGFELRGATEQELKDAIASVT